MPVISRFFGIVVFMNFNEHAPPHFHARYQDQEVTIEIQTGVATGRMSRRALDMIFTWLDAHKDELIENWNLARDRQSLNQIDPLN